MSQARSARPFRRGVGVLASVLVALLLLGVAIREVRQEALRRAAYPQDSGGLAIAGIAARVTVLRDARGVPHVIASEEPDAYAGLGFVHAQDRLGQMLWLRLQAAGRTAEVLGEQGLPADRMARILGFGRRAKLQAEGLEPVNRRRLEAYVAGVNARLDRVRSGAVPEPGLVREVGLALDRWTVADTLAVYAQYAWALDNSVEATLVLTDLIQQLGSSASGRFFPGAGLQARPPAFESAGSQRERALAGEATPLAPLPAEAGALRRALGFDGFGIGSSAWVVAGNRTERGHPIVAIDHHLPPTAPAWFYLGHLRADGLDVAGATLPGVPVFFSGHNSRVAWGAVSAGAVVTDLYTETLHPSDDERYHDGRRWRPLVVIEETLAVRDGPSVPLTVRETFHGPLLPRSKGRAPLSISWPGLDAEGRGGIEALLEIARAWSASELLTLLSRHREPVLAFAYADVAGSGGLHVAGWVPRRSLSSQLQPLPGRARWYHWEERVPFDLLPSARLSGDVDWLVAADDSLAERGTEPVDWLWRSGARAARIDAQLAAALRRGKLDLRTVADVQTDRKSDRALALKTSLLQLLEQAGTRLGPQALEVVRLLEGWDGEMTVESAGAAAYHSFLHPFADRLLTDAMGPELWRRYVGLPQTEIEPLVLDFVEDAVTLGDAAAADRMASLAAASLQRAWLELTHSLGSNPQGWRWGALHSLRFRPFAGIGQGIASSYDYGGGVSTVAAGAYDPLEPFEVEVASVVRFAFDTGSLDQSLAVLAPGQSEHRGHPHAEDQVESWLAGRPALLPTGPLLVEEAGVTRLVLEPVR